MSEETNYPRIAILLLVIGLFVSLVINEFIDEPDTSIQPVIAETGETKNFGLITDFNPPDHSDPEHTVRTFLWAAKNGKKDMALFCLNEDKISVGRHAISNIDEYLEKIRRLDVTSLQFSSSNNRVSVRTIGYAMDYDLELRSGELFWEIVSIHP